MDPTRPCAASCAVPRPTVCRIRSSESKVARWSGGQGRPAGLGSRGWTAGARQGSSLTPAVSPPGCSRARSTALDDAARHKAAGTRTLDSVDTAPQSDRITNMRLSEGLLNLAASLALRERRAAHGRSPATPGHWSCAERTVAGESHLPPAGPVLRWDGWHAFFFYKVLVASKKTTRARRQLLVPSGYHSDLACRAPGKGNIIYYPNGCLARDFADNRPTRA